MTAKVYIHQFSSLSTAGDNAGYLEAIFADKRLPLPWIDDFAGKRIRFGQIDERHLISEKTIKEPKQSALKKVEGTTSLGFLF